MLRWKANVDNNKKLKQVKNINSSGQKYQIK